jgi:hypothetical protein
VDVGFEDIVLRLVREKVFWLLFDVFTGPDIRREQRKGMDGEGERGGRVAEDAGRGHGGWRERGRKEAEDAGRGRRGQGEDSSSLQTSK